MSIPPSILKKLQETEPDRSFEGRLPVVKSSSGATYFVKLGSPKDEAQFIGEAESLKAIEHAAPSLAPKLFSVGALESGTPYFISQYIEMCPLSYQAAEILAERMATALHSHTNASAKGFGFSVPTYCGATKLKNGWFQRWDECYASMIGDLLDQLANQGKFIALCTKGEIIKNQVIPKVLGSLDIKPVILHGDLWIGNTGLDKATGQPIIFDPASYFGHNEADLSIARIFGGFPESFFSAYHKYLPKTEPVDQYELRMDLYELFHYLNHALIFGGHYAGCAERKMDNLTSALRLGPGRHNGVPNLAK
ncbi:hypothetical protein M413DRAFT_439439, partial [Hebeloma cylindrosporum]